MKRRETMDAVFMPLWATGVTMAVRAAYASTWFQRYVERHGPEAIYPSSLGLSFVVFWTHSALMMVIDYTKPAWATQFKVQPDKYASSSMTWSAVKVALVNLLAVALPMSIVMFKVVLPWRGVVPHGLLPSWGSVVFEFCSFLVVEEFLFYYSHRMFHTRALYATYHKKHHEFTAPIGVAAVYCTPVEMAVANVFPLMAGPVLMGSHVTTTTAWFCVALINTVQTHSGYDFPFMACPRAHDFHHETFNENFGVLGVLDTVHHTNVKFLERMAEQTNAQVKKPKAA
ncbi:hypothetical protein, variant [Aphanomyces invadans]|uniref:Fatty acid hydroxylase domain-containing protein n=1 Tax=Aphanomyces invadans TaxID=157072 RepID=A0A024UQS4_9STRA|nr:hypothetical protein, variant [Aphanomyces invadans]ETW08207.1 hypothetical protein, variant [Aphanomyces invadans]|eukprot:XP_008862012.1 hypothetical protein, variant [Aphanomyces invadans]